MWKLYLYYQILNDDLGAINDTFYSGLKQLKTNSLPLWTMMLRYHLLTSDNSVVDSLYQEAVTQPKEISDHMKPRYIEWLNFTYNIRKARASYLKLAEEKPYCKQLHLAMAQLESTQLEPNFKCWEMVLRITCDQFGTEDVEAWLNYVRFFYTNQQLSVTESVRKIYEEATSKLPDLLKMDFEERYNVLVNSA